MLAGSRTPIGLPHLLRRAVTACTRQPRRCAVRRTSSTPPRLAPRVPGSAIISASRIGVATVRCS